MYKRDIKLNGYFINYFVVTLWEMEMTKSQCKAAVPRDWETGVGVRSLPPAGMGGFWLVQILPAPNKISLNSA